MKLHRFIRKRKDIWSDPEQIETMYLENNETLVDFYKNELEEVVRLYQYDYELDYENLAKELLSDVWFHYDDEYVIRFLYDMDYKPEHIVELTGLDLEKIQEIFSDYTID